MTLSAAQRVLRARAGGLSTAAKGHVVVGPAHKAFQARFYANLPDGLSQAEQDKRAAAARRLYFTRLALKSSVVRSEKKAGRGGSESRGPATEASGDATRRRPPEA